MLNAVSVRLSSLLLKRINHVKYSQDVYTYGIEILLSTMLEIMAILLSAAFLSSAIEGIIFVVLFLSLRFFTGGYHANTYRKCFAVTVGSFWAVLLATTLFMRSGLVRCLYITLICSAVYIIARSPIINERQPLSTVSIIKNGKIAAIILFIHLGTIHHILSNNERRLVVAILTIDLVAAYMLITDRNIIGGNDNGNHRKNY